MKTISIITVSYNSEATISDTLRSINEQSYVDIEHIVIDGGSTDATIEIVKSEGKRVRILVSEPDQGIYDAMNKGLSLASGELVGFLNADDVFADPNAVSRIASAFTKDKVDAAYGDLAYVDEQNLNQVVRYWQSGEFSPEGLRWGWMPPHPTFYIRRHLIAEVGNFDTSLRIAADYDFMLRCLSKPNFNLAYIKSLQIRMRTGGVSNRSLRALWHKSNEDLLVMQRNQIGGVVCLISKNLRKLPQFLYRRSPIYQSVESTD